MFERVLIWLFRKIIVLMALLATTPLSAQQWILSKKLDVANGGLPQNSCSSIYFDKKSGFLWIATQSGLVRYDGKESQVFNTQNITNIETARIAGIFSTTGGTIFSIAKPYSPILLHDNRATAINTNNPQFWALCDYITNVSVPYLINRPFRCPPDNSGFNKYFYDHVRKILWVNDTDRVIAYDDSVYYLSADRMLGRWPCRSGEGVKLIKRANGIYIADGPQWHFLDTRTRRFTALKIDGVLSSPNATLFYGVQDEYEPRLVQGSDVYEVTFDHLAPAARFFARLPEVPGNINSLIFSHDKQEIYCATTLNGVFIYQLSHFKSYNISTTSATKLGIAETERTDANNCYATVQTDSNHLLTYNGVRYNLEDGSFERLKLPLDVINGDRMKMAYLGGDWIAISGPWLYNLKTGEKVKIANHSLYACFSDNDGNRWFAGKDIFMLSGRKIIKRFSYEKFPDSIKRILQKEGVYEAYIAGLTYDRQLLVAYQNCFVAVDIRHQTASLKFCIPKPPGRVPTMDTSGLYCWIPTYGNGLYLYDVKEDHLYTAPMDARKYLAYSHTLAQDGQGNLLITTNNGLFRINEQALIYACKKREKYFAYEFYNTENGLNCTEFNGGCVPAFNTLSNGDVVFPSQNGLERVMVRSFARPKCYPLYIENVATTDTVYDYHDNLQFGRDERLLTWKLGFAQWSGLYATGLAYRLDDQPDWTYAPAGVRSIQLADMAGGEHQLQIRNQCDLSGKRFQMLTTRFTIKEKFYEMVLFWIVLLVCLILLTIFITQLVTQQLRRRNILLEEKVAEKTIEINIKNEELEETLEDLQDTMIVLRNNSNFQKELLSLMGHDFMLPLQYISKVTDQLIKYKQQLSHTTRDESIVDINGTATSLMYLGQNIIQWIRLQEGSFRLQHEYFRLDEAIDKLLQLHYQLASGKGNVLFVNLEVNDSLHYDPVAIRIIIHNLLTNANKFTTGGTVSLRIYCVGDSLTIDVRDTGIGMDAAKADSLNRMEVVRSVSGTDQEEGWGLGYRLIIDLVKVSDGHLVIESEKAQGTTVTIFLPGIF